MNIRVILGWMGILLICFLLFVLYIFSQKGYKGLLSYFKLRNVNYKHLLRYVFAIPIGVCVAMILAIILPFFLKNRYVLGFLRLEIIHSLIDFIIVVVVSYNFVSIPYFVAPKYKIAFSFFAFILSTVLLVINVVNQRGVDLYSVLSFLGTIIGVSYCYYCEKEDES